MGFDPSRQAGEKGGFWIFSINRRCRRTTYKRPEKLKVRHILLKKIVFLIFFNNHLTVYQAVVCCLERKKQTFFLSKVCLTFNFSEF